MVLEKEIKCIMGGWPGGGGGKERHSKRNWSGLERSCCGESKLKRLAPCKWKIAMQ